MSIFSSIHVPKLKRTKFNLSHNVKLTANQGTLYPIFCEPVLPGDTFKISSELFMRMAPMIAPLMSKVDIYVHYFFVPNRLLWSHWEDFITGGEDGEQSDAHPYPLLAVPAHSPLFQTRTLADYLGFPVFDYKDSSDLSKGTIDNRLATKGFTIDALPFKAYACVYNEYYRDQNVSEKLDLFKDQDGVHTPAESQQFLQFRKRAWKKDYFTSALPTPQRGADVMLPLQGDAPLVGNRNLNVEIDQLKGGPGQSPHTNVMGAYAETDRNGNLVHRDSSLNIEYKTGTSANPGTSYEQVWMDIPRFGVKSALSVSKEELESQFHVDLSQVSSTTINELRNAFAAQRYLEAMARGGSRYIEQIYSIFGVRSSDARLQRPEYLGGGLQPVMVSDVLQTSSTIQPDEATDDPGSPQGNQSGVGASAGRTASFKRFFEEHGYIIGIMSIIPKASYQQGMPRKYLKRDRFDFFWPQFAHLGEQAIQNQELYYSPDRGTQQQESEFGYTPRYAEYKYIPDRVHGEFRNSLNFWHLGRIFNNTPGLNQTFIECNPSYRVFAVKQNSSVDHFYFNINHKVKAARLMPRYGTPK